MNKSSLGKNLRFTVGVGLLTLGLACNPLQSEALAGKTKDKVCNTLCNEEAEFGLIAYSVGEHEFIKGQNVWIVKKVCFGDEELDGEGGGYAMMQIKYNPKIHGKFKVLKCNTEVYGGNQPTVERKDDIIVLVAGNKYELPGTDMFYRVNLEDYSK